MKPKIISKTFFVCAIAISLFGMFSIPSNALAQPGCPDSTGPAPNPSQVPWVWNNGIIGLAPCGLQIDVYYCQRFYYDTTTKSYVFQIWLDSVAAILNSSDSACYDTMTPQEIIYAADSIAYAVLSIPSPYPQFLCDSGYYLFVEGYLPQCWVQQTYADRISPLKGSIPLSGTRTKTYTWCSPQNTFCLTTCQLCFTEKKKPVYSNCTTQSFGNPNCPPGNHPWTDGTCYSIACNFTAPGGTVEPMGITSPDNIDQDFKLYPNPAAQNLMIRSANTGAQVSVLDVLGRPILHGIIAANGTLLLDISSLQSGTYFVSIGQKEVKFVKQ